MIQRIQSLYLILSIVFLSFTFFVPLVRYVDNSSCFTMNSMNYSMNESTDFFFSTPYVLVICTLCTLLISFAAIWKYKNRRKQLRFVKWGLFMNIFWYVAFIAYVLFIKAQTSTVVSFELGCLYPLLSFIMLFLSYKAIKHDDDLVKAADRIR